MLQRHLNNFAFLPLLLFRGILIFVWCDCGRFVVFLLTGLGVFYPDVPFLLCLWIKKASFVLALLVA
jgi:hypothetical protein